MLLPIIFSGIGVTECKVPTMAVLFLTCNHCDLIWISDKFMSVTRYGGRSRWSRCTSLILNPARILVEAPRNGAGTSNEGEKDEFVSGNWISVCASIVRFYSSTKIFSAEFWAAASIWAVNADDTLEAIPFVVEGCFAMSIWWPDCSWEDKRYR